MDYSAKVAARDTALRQGQGAGLTDSFAQDRLDARFDRIPLIG
jgi:hypothetical protein